MFDTSELLKIAKAACEAAIESGAHFADASAANGKSLSVEIESSSIKSAEAQTVGGVSVRSIYCGGVGWSSSDALNIDSAISAGRDSARLARLAEPDPHFISLPKPSDDYPEVEGLFDIKVAELNIQTLAQWAKENINEAKSINDSAIVEGSFGASFSFAALANSLGIALTSQSSQISGGINAIVKNGDEVGSFYDFDAARRLADFNPTGIGTSATQQAEKFLGAKSVETGRMDIILGPLASMSIFGAIANAIDAENIQRGRSFMINKEKKRICSDLITLIDDPFIPYGLSSRRFDSEGTPCQRLAIVKEGILQTYLYSSYTAGKAGTKPTGNGSRGASASVSNLIPSLGNISSDEIIRQTKRGIYINMGGIRPDLVTGDVSNAIDFGFYIEDGKFAFPVAQTMIGGSFLDMLMNIDAVSSDARVEPGMIMPTIRIRDVLVAGGH